MLASLRRSAPTQAVPCWPVRSLCAVLLVAVALVATGCAAVRHEVARPESQALKDPQESALGRRLQEQLAPRPGMSGFRLLASGQEAFLARAALAEAAQHTLDLQYYVVASDSTGTLLMYSALRAAQRGVRVRLLIDDLDAEGRDIDFATLAAHPNVQVRVFNSRSRRNFGAFSRVLDYLDDGTRLNRRMHNKLWIADNVAALIGGRNLGDAYFNVGAEASFVDLDVLAAGPVVAQASRSFDEFWNSEWALPIQVFSGPTSDAPGVGQLMADMAERASAFRDTDYGRALRATDLAVLVRSGQLGLVVANASVLYDPPAKLVVQTPQEGGHAVGRLRSAIVAAQEEVILISPYFVPSQTGVQVLCDLARRGVRVRVLTNSLASTDHAAVHAGYARYRPGLLACGVALYELRPSAVDAGRVGRVLSSGLSLHAKAIMVDGKTVLIGSMNLDPRSRLSNTEIAVLIDSPVIGSQLRSMFEGATSLEAAFRPELTEPGNPASPLAWSGREDGKLQRYTSEPLASWWQRAATELLGVLVPEELL